jgi:hypothetical protein
VGGFRIRWPFTIIWTAVCLWAITMLAQGGSQPVSADCFDSCGLEGQIAAILIPAVIVVWLVVTITAAWLWTWATRIRCPRCRYIVEPPVRFCPNCGYDLLEDI